MQIAVEKNIKPFPGFRNEFGEKLFVNEVAGFKLMVEAEGKDAVRKGQRPSEPNWIERSCLPFFPFGAQVRRKRFASRLFSVKHFEQMTTANKITIIRILMIPFFVVETIYYVRTGLPIHWLLAILSFAATAILDGVDGYIARHYKQISELGKILDPLADKMLLVSGIVLLSFDNRPYFRQIPLWLTGLIIGRDLLLGIGAMVIHFVVGKASVRPRITGKIATVFQMLVIIWILLRWDTIFHGRFLEIWIWGAGIFTGISGLLYVFDGMNQLSAHPASSPTQKNNP
jgi:CDP-diacylglycerol--glycerol-3-phosphate 3-phosphatidyltransferase